MNFYFITLKRSDPLKTTEHIEQVIYSEFMASSILL